MNNEREQIKQSFMQLLCELHPLAKEMSLSDLALDEIDMIELIIAIEDSFSITVDDELFFTCTSIDQIVDYIVQCKMHDTLLT